MSLFSDAHQVFRDSVKDFVQDRLTPNGQRWEDEAGFPVSLFRELGERGFLGLSYPPAYGGRGLDFGYNVAFVEELAASRIIGVTLSIIAQAHFFPPLLLAHGTEEQKRTFLEPAIRGEKIGALAATEPGGGSDLVRAVECTAIDDGDFWSISGEKKFITNGPIADFIVTLVRTRPGEQSPRSLSLVIVPTDTPGFRTKTILRKLGCHSSPTGWLEFRDCRVPKSLTLGQRNLGFFYISQAFIEERLIGCASAVAFAGLVLADTIQFVRSRMAFGQPLSKLQVIRHRISEMAADLEMVRRFAYSVCESYRDGKVEAKEISMIKFKVPEVAQRIIAECLQLHGGSGFLEENWISRAYRDIRFLSVGGGASEVMKDLVASYLRL